jgi:hypothetical protein
MNVRKAIFHWGEMAFKLRKSWGILNETLTIVSSKQLYPSTDSSRFC